MKRAAIVTRVSTTEQADSRLGLDSQLRLCVEALRRHDPLIPSELFSDPGVSGSVPLAMRKEGRRLTEAIERGEIGIVVALAQDRLFRSLLDALATLQRWDELGVRVLLVDGGWISLDDDDQFAATAMRALFAEMERRAARKRTKRALDAARSRGVKLGRVPFGSRTAARTVDGRRVNGGVHVPKYEEQVVIARIREWRYGRSGVVMRSFREVANLLNAERIPGPRGGKWAGESVRRVLMREA